MPNFSTAKSELRKNMLIKRSEMSITDREEASQAIGESVISLPEYEEATTIFTYVSTDDEPSTIALIDDALSRQKRVCVPRCETLGIMRAHEIQSRDDLQRGKYDILEPKENCPRISPENIDLNIVPCVCSCEQGYRLGYGGGFYDRWLEKSTAPAILLCFEDMILPSVPLEQHDRQVDILISNKRGVVRR